MDTVTPYMNETFSFLQSGYAGVNTAVGLLIALLITIMMKEWKKLWAMALVGTLFHLILDAFMPMLRGGAFRLPANLISLDYVLFVLATYIGFVIVISIFFFVKKNVLKAA